ncbi:EAL domain-containing protein [Marinobacterium sp. D7]|uniref:putative bifunctional diguanylate cyclase/phosphodiesterase n=1 Tax=Marinobacterium ramblicola TaxID=2849041 RepID=UPI001C2DACC1|nr:bifunctional diguanylate cyclase/phosphodiesterase [Marinobacterium ramblicola]MBV1788146.1 EAL domain-containing protein [Marinobacterium ramblicola]
MSISKEQQRSTVPDGLSAQDEIARQLQEAVEFSEVILEAIPDTLFEVDLDGRYHRVWAKDPALLALHEQFLVGRTVEEVLHPQAAGTAMAAILEADMKGRCSGLVIPIEQQNGETGWFEHTIVKKSGSGHSSSRFIVLSRDISDRKRTERVIDEAKRHLHTVLRTIPDKVWLKDAEGTYLLCNHAFEGLVGKSEKEIVGGTDYDLFGRDIADFFREKDRAALAAGQTLINEEWVTHAGSGETILLETRKVPVPGPDGTAVGILGVARDITELSASRDKIHRMAYYDTLTSLPNRGFFNDSLKLMLGNAKQHGHMAGVMLIDLDHFKAVNDTLGHPVGDGLLHQAAKRLCACVRDRDMVARLGGDEFAVVLPKINNAVYLSQIAERVLEAFNEVFLLDEREVFVSCSIGLATYPHDGTEADDLLRYADTAMYQAKRSGRNAFRFYSADLTTLANERLLLESELRRAIERGELELHYQPKLMLNDQIMIGSEALLRWCHPEKGMIPPDQFIPIAEESALIKELGQWVLREACRTAVEMNAEGRPPHKVAVNLSAKEFQWPNLAGRVADILQESGCRAEWIEIEITESLLLEENTDTIETLSAMRNMGITIAVDDFGTGYSSLAYLTRLPIDTLKLDRSFINSADRRNLVLVKAVLDIARGLGQSVVAEGIETIEQANFLASHGCNAAQGFLYSRPLPKEEIMRLPQKLL